MKKFVAYSVLSMSFSYLESHAGAEEIKMKQETVFGC